MSNRVPSLWSGDPFEDVFRGLMKPMRWDVAAETPAIKLDVNETDQAYSVKADIPGVRKEDIHVTVEGRQVSISAEVRKENDEKKDGRVIRSERSYGYASRAFVLDHEVEADKVTAKYQDGVLALELPKRTGSRAGKIQIA
ncbi:MAG: Hsp20/alpha crystallin family protein [Ideonella sp.]|nr:Hsp20/alpha crystallin family protein [Ideonella sp.]